MAVQDVKGIVNAVQNIKGKVNIIPSGGGGSDPVIQPLSITENGTYTAPSGVDGYSPVVANVPTGPAKSASDVTVSGKTVTVPAGLYSAQVQKSVADGTEGTPTATKSVSGHTATVTPSVTNQAGYIAGGTKNGTPVTVAAAELASGTKSITENGNGIDVVGYEYVNVNVPSQAPVIQSKTITENGTYTPPTGVDGFAPVVVNVQGGGGGNNWSLPQIRIFYKVVDSYVSSDAQIYKYANEETLLSNGFTEWEFNGGYLDAFRNGFNFLLGNDANWTPNMYLRSNGPVASGSYFTAAMSNLGNIGTVCPGYTIGKTFGNALANILMSTNIPLSQLASPISGQCVPIPFDINTSGSATETIFSDSNKEFFYKASGLYINNTGETAEIKSLCWQNGNNDFRVMTAQGSISNVQGVISAYFLGSTQVFVPNGKNIYWCTRIRTRKMGETI